MTMKVGEKEMVVPGDLIAVGRDYLIGEGTYREGDNVRASIFGPMSAKGKLLKVIPLSGRYVPREGDVVIGVIEEIRFSNWGVDINSAYKAALLVGEASERFIDTKSTDMSEFFAVGDAVVCEIILVDENINVNVTMRGPGLRKITEGRIIDVAPAKVPRVIGKNGSMVKIIKAGTGCNVIVGQNGRVWIQGPNKESENKALMVLKRIEAEAHLPDLTNKIKDMLGVKGDFDGETQVAN